MSFATRCVLSICVSIAVFSGCGALRQTQNDMLGAMPQSVEYSTQRDGGKSWMLAEAKHEDLLYASVTGCGGTCVYSYPNGKLVGTLDVDGGLLCSDGSGDVFVPS
ncbi:MAG: hypothetical protein WB526_04520 [Candidatus Cybelea sp.]